MQTIRHDGSKGPPTHFDEEVMKEMLDDPAVKEVRVFKEPDKTDDKESKSRILERPATQQQMPKTFILQKGMRVSIGNRLYKITTARPNGKITMRLIKNAKL